MRVSRITLTILLAAATTLPGANARPFPSNTSYTVFNCSDTAHKVGVARSHAMHETLDNSKTLDVGASGRWKIQNSEADISILRNNKWKHFDDLKGGSYRIVKVTKKSGRAFYKVVKTDTDGCK
ncbi:MAG: hypothetical protein AAFX54_03185 [Pseudomonadota bacterium]